MGSRGWTLNAPPQSSRFRTKRFAGLSQCGQGSQPGPSPGRLLAHGPASPPGTPGPWADTSPLSACPSSLPSAVAKDTPQSASCLRETLARKEEGSDTRFGGWSRGQALLCSNAPHHPRPPPGALCPLQAPVPLWPPRASSVRADT